MTTMMTMINETTKVNFFVNTL